MAFRRTLLKLNKVDDKIKAPQKVFSRLVLELNHLDPKMAFFCAEYEPQKFSNWHKESILKYVIKDLFYEFRSDRERKIIINIEAKVMAVLNEYYSWVF